MSLPAFGCFFLLSLFWSVTMNAKDVKSIMSYFVMSFFWPVPAGSLYVQVFVHLK